jgi:type IV pilus assembly protein PilO
MPAPTLTRPSLPKLTKRPRLPKRESAVPRSQIERLWLVAGGLIAFVMLLIGYFFFISPQRSNTSEVDARAATVQSQNSLLQARLDALRAENENLSKYEADLAALKQALPSTSGISDFLRTLQSLGNATLTDVTSLSVGQPISVTPVAPVTAAQPTAPAEPVPSSTVAAPIASAAPVAYALPISLSASGSATALTKFLDQLQAVQPRAVLISDVGLSGGDSAAGDNGAFTLNLTMHAFVVPVSPAEDAALSASAAASAGN